jgi:beta-phosphoglucomutase-like phosphatase (HAD superfamily)
MYRRRHEWRQVGDVIEAVVFDMDGLLVDSEPAWDAARRWMADEAGMAWTAQDHQAVMGVSTAEWTAYMIERLQLSMPPVEVEARIIGRMVDGYHSGVPYLSGAVEAVELVTARYPAAIASGSHPALIEAVTSDQALRGRFKVVLSADEVGAGKPAPDVYIAAAERLGVAPPDCVCLEDSGNGILSGVRAGMRVIAVPDERFPPPDDVLGLAHVVLGSLGELTLDSIEVLGRP